MLGSLLRRLHLPGPVALAVCLGAVVLIVAAVLFAPSPVGLTVGLVVGGATLTGDARRLLRRRRQAV